MKIHHLNCATMCPPSPRILQGEGPLFGFSRMVCHCLLIESRDGLILVDTGLGTSDLAHPREHLGSPFLTFTRPTLNLEETALHQVKALGFKPSDVRHLVLTHLDLDHAGGIPDFPEASVHVSYDEHRAALHPTTFFEKHRYRPQHWAHGPKWVTHAVDGEQWRGFDCVRALDATDDVLLVPMPGHTRGHACIAVNTGDGWLLHCGDAYFFREEVNPAHPRRTPGFTAFQWLAYTCPEHPLAVNHARLQRLVAEHGRDVSVFCAHDPVEHAWLTGERSGSAPPGLAQRQNTR